MPMLRGFWNWRRGDAVDSVYVTSLPGRSAVLPTSPGPLQRVGVVSQRVITSIALAVTLSCIFRMISYPSSFILQIVPDILIESKAYRSLLHPQIAFSCLELPCLPPVLPP